MHAAYARLGRFAVRHRWAVVAAWVAATVLAAQFLPSLASVIKADNTDFLPPGTPSVAAARLASPVQSAKLTAIPVVVARPGGRLTAADTTYYQQRLLPALRSVSHVVAVRDYGRSPDGQVEQLQALADVAMGQDGPLKVLVSTLRAAVGRSAPPAGLAVHLAGVIATAVDGQARGASTGNQVQGLSVAFIVLLLLAIFRAPLAPLLTLAPAFVVTQLAGPLIAEATRAGLQVSQLSQLMLIVLVLGAGTDYGLFLVFRVREELRAGQSPHRAVQRAVERVGESISFSAGTVIAALLSLLVATFGVYSSLGAPLAIGVFLMLLAALTLLPALVAIAGRAMFWPTRTSAGSGRPGLWGRLAGRIVARPAATLGVGLALFGGLAVAATGYTASGFGTALSAPRGTDSAAGNAILDAHFPRAAANPTTVILRFPRPVWRDPAVLATAQSGLLATGLFSAVDGPTMLNGQPVPVAVLARLHTLLGDPHRLPAAPAEAGVPAGAYRLYRAEANLISPDGRTVAYLTGLAIGDPSTTAALHVVPRLRAAVTRLGHRLGAVATGVAGEAPGVYDVATTSNRDLLKVVPLAIAVIGVLLGLVMRSLVAPLYLIASVALSYLAALGLAVLAFETLGHSNGLTFILPFLMFLFLLALGEDYNILVMTRIREEAATLPLPEAVRRALGATGSTVTSAGLVLAGTFAVFAVAGDRGAGGGQVLDIGAGLALGVLMDTFLVRTLLVPATVVLLGRWNWWPGRLRPGPARPDPDSQPKKTAASA